MKKILAGLLAVLSLVVSNPAPVQASTVGQPTFRVNDQVVNVLGYAGREYILARSGAMYVPQGVYYGGLNGRLQPGRYAARLLLCIKGETPIGYAIVDSAGIRHDFGPLYPGCPKWYTKNQPTFWLDSDVTWVKTVNRVSYILTVTGAVYAPDGYYFGGANGQPYFTGEGRRANWLEICIDPWQGLPTYYTIIDMTGSRYRYGSWPAICYVPGPPI